MSSWLRIDRTIMEDENTKVRKRETDLAVRVLVLSCFRDCLSLAWRRTSSPQSAVELLLASNKPKSSISRVHGIGLHTADPWLTLPKRPRFDEPGPKRFPRGLSSAAGRAPS